MEGERKSEKQTTVLIQHRFTGEKKGMDADASFPPGLISGVLMSGRSC